MRQLNLNIHAQIAGCARAAFLSIVLGWALLMPATLVFAVEPVHYEGAVSYVTGGVSDESLDELKSMSSGFNLKLVFALKSGEFLSDVHVAILDRSGTTLLDATSDGPWLLAKLPRGEYQVVASQSGNSIRHKVIVEKGTLRTVDFRWSNE